MFFVVAAVFAYVFVGPNLAAIALDVACIFAAILFTEIVQALVYRSFGLRCTVVIQEFGGGVTPDSEPPYRIQRITAALSCPASSFLLYALLYYSNQEYHWDAPGNNVYVRFAFTILKIVSLFWGIIGLLPMFPWPGGRVLAEILSFISPRYGFEAMLWFSILLGLVLLADTAWMLLGNPSELPYLNQLGPNSRIILGLFFLLATIRNWQILQYVRAVRRQHAAEYSQVDDREPWER
jgi:stage IV sporulation protein FB